MENYFEAFTNARGLLNMKYNKGFFVKKNPDESSTYKVFVPVSKLAVHCEDDIDKADIIYVNGEYVD